MFEPSGFLVVQKPAGVTSHDVVGFARRRLGTKKVGHAGTLDPMATGVLVLGVGRGTRLLEYLVGCDKEYDAELTFGATSNTYDAEGAITTYSHLYQGGSVQESLTPTLSQREGGHQVGPEEITAVLPGFTGEIQQVPPVFSAIKIGGQTAHKLARAGEKVELAPRAVTIHSIQLTKCVHPHAELRVHCGSGTYIRSLAHDLGQQLGVGAYLSKLARTRVGQFHLRDAVTLHHIRPENLLPLKTGVANMQRRSLTTLERTQLMQGQKISTRDCSDAEIRAGFCGDELVAILKPEIEKGVLRPVKVLANN